MNVECQNQKLNIRALEAVVSCKLTVVRQNPPNNKPKTSKHLFVHSWRLFYHPWHLIKKESIKLNLYPCLRNSILFHPMLP